jgi:SAM-dependent methyltransferase
MINRQEEVRRTRPTADETIYGLNQREDREGQEIQNKLMVAGIVDDLKSNIPNFGKHPITEVGCSNGVIVEGIAKLNPNTRINGFDISPKDIELAQRRAVEMKLGNVRFGVRDVLKRPIPSGQGTVLFKNVFEWLGGQEVRVMTECREALIPGEGAIVAITFHEPDQIFSNFPPFQNLVGRVGEAMRLGSNANMRAGGTLPQFMEQAGFKHIHRTVLGFDIAGESEDGKAMLRASELRMHSVGGIATRLGFTPEGWNEYSDGIYEEIRNTLGPDGKPIKSQVKIAIDYGYRDSIK